MCCGRNIGIKMCFSRSDKHFAESERVVKYGTDYINEALSIKNVINAHIVVKNKKVRLLTDL